MFNEIQPNANWDLVPKHLRGGLLRYLDEGIDPGHFMSAVLENDLFEAMGRADEGSRAGLFGLCSFIYSYAPIGCKGSPDAVKEWMRNGGLKGLEKTHNEDEAA